MTITDAHEQQFLLPRGITATDAAAYGVTSIGAREELPEALQNSKYATVPGLLFPWKSPLAGTVLQYRPDEPVANRDGDPVKYLFEQGASMVLNILRDSGDGPLLIQEGTMQSLAAAVYAHPGWNIAGLSGCWSWRKGETAVAIPDLMIADGRDVVIGLDADAATNLDVYNAGMALMDALEAEGAHSIRFLRLDGHGGKAGLDDVLGSRPVDRRAGYLKRLLERAEEKPAKAKPARKNRSASKQAPLSSPDRPLIMVNDDRRDVINQMTEALQNRWNGDGLFGYGGILAQRTGVEVAPVTEGVFADLIAEAALCVTVNSKGDAMPAWPDEKSMKAVLSRADRFAPLERISQVPFVRPDGSISQTPGYDESTSTFLVLDPAVETMTVPEEPGEEDVRSAVKLLTEEWLGDLMAIMPEPEDRANCLAMMLTPLIRGLVPLAPLAVVDGLQMGVGKNLVSDCLSIFATGAPAQPLPYSREDEENKKVITSSFRAGHDLFVFDEAHTIEGAHLARSITSITYSDRILGVSNMIEFPNRVTWVALGNNVSINGDLSRRVYRIRLAPKEANPQDRDVATFRHPDLKRWTKEHRPELIGAALTLIRAWFVAGQVENAAGRRFGSFEPWGGMVGGILDNAGVEGFLGSLVEWRSETDYETSYWTDHFTWLRAQFADAEFTVPEVVSKMVNSRHVEHPPRLEDHKATGYNRALGLAYGRVKGRIIGGHQLVKAADFSGHSNRWMVLDRRPGAVVDPAVEVGDAGADPSPAEVVRVDRVVSPPLRVMKSELTYAHTPVVDQNSDLAGIPYYPLYPNYPPTKGADPLASLTSLCADVPTRICPDCDGAETLTPSGFYYACPVCHPRTFLR